MDRAARVIQSNQRRRAYAELDIRLARQAAPVAAVNVIDEVTLVSDACRLHHPPADPRSHDGLPRGVAGRS